MSAFRIELKCSCGAEASFSDTSGEGRKPRVEVLSDRWQERHRACMKKEIVLSDKPGLPKPCSRCGGNGWEP